MVKQKEVFAGILVLIVLGLASCSGSGSETKAVTQDSIIEPTTLNESRKWITSASDTVTISERSVVYYSPDSLQMEKRIKEVGESVFMAGADDYFYYLHLAGEFTDSARLKTFALDGRRWLKFVSSDQSLQIIRTDTLSELFGAFFFDPSKKAKQIDLIEVEKEYKEYFK